MPMTVATWNLFHGRCVPAVHADRREVFARGLAGGDWDVCALQEVPPWWVPALADATGSVARVATTSLVRGALPRLQRLVHDRDPERLGAAGAGVNVILVRLRAGRVDAHRTATLRWLPQRRSVQAIRLVRPGGRAIWVANLHAHNRPPSAAQRDAGRGLAQARAWAEAAGDERLVVLGDLNVAEVDGLASHAGLARLHGHRVDQILERGLRADGGQVAVRMKAPGGGVLSDHRLVSVRIADAPAR